MFADRYEQAITPNDSRKIVIGKLILQSLVDGIATVEDDA